MFSTYTHPPPPFPNETFKYTSPDPPLALLPLYQPPPLPEGQFLPKLDPRRPAPLTIPGYTLSRHTLPAAWPRTLPGNVCTGDESTKALFDPYGAPTGPSKAERKAAIGKVSLRCTEVYDEAFPKRRSGVKEEMEGLDEKRFWLAMDRYTLNSASSSGTTTTTSTGTTQRRDRQPVTLLCCHANGFHKEMFIPTLKSLLSRLSHSRDEAGVELEVEEILLVDIYNHGESYLLNDGNVGLVGEWGDTARDLISLLRHCLPPRANEVDPTSLSEALDFRPASEDGVEGLGGRRVVGIGHSIGGNSLVQAAHAFPNLFHSLVLIDPMTRALEDYERLANFPGGHPLIASCIGRRETWSSREEARRELIKSPYFQAWDSGVFDSFIDYGLVEVDRIRSQGGKGQGVTLVTPRWAEAEMFAASRGMFDGFDKLNKLRKDLKVTFVMAEDSSSTGGPIRTHNMVWKAPRSENYIVKGAGHLVMQEKPDAVAQLVHRSLMGLPVETSEKVYADKAKL